MFVNIRIYIYIYIISSVVLTHSYIMVSLVNRVASAGL